MSLFNLDKNFIFIHIPKTGGTSMEALGFIGEGYNKHYDAKFFNDTYGYKFDKAFKFAFVRDPYTRFASGVLGHAIASSKMDEMMGIMSGDEAKAINKDRFTAFTLKHRDNFDSIIAIRQQHLFVTIDNQIVMDFIGRFENLQEDFNKVCKKLGYSDTTLPHMVKGRYNDYEYFYTPETKEIVSDYYKKDFELFNYKRG